jgi:hypothetical protein
VKALRQPAESHHGGCLVAAADAVGRALGITRYLSPWSARRVPPYRRTARVHDGAITRHNVWITFKAPENFAGIRIGVRSGGRSMPTRKRTTARSQRLPMATGGSTVGYAELLKNYGELAEGVRMIRRAAERASRSGVLPPLDDRRRSPLEECEAIARAIYRSARRPPRDVGPGSLAGVDLHDRPTDVTAQGATTRNGEPA